MPAAGAGFQAYVAANMLGRLPWRRRYLNLLGPRVATSVFVIGALKATFLIAAALGKARPGLVQPILESSSGPGGDLYGFGEGRVLELVCQFQRAAYRATIANKDPVEALNHLRAVRTTSESFDPSPEKYEDLFPDDAKALQNVEAWRTVLHRDFSFMLAQTRVVEGLVFGEKFPEVTRQLLETEIREGLSTRDRARADGVGFGPMWERVEDAERDATEIAVTWQSLAGSGVHPASR